MQLGIPDGSIESPADLRDPMISRIGGHPVRASRHICSFRILNAFCSVSMLCTQDVPRRARTANRICALWELCTANATARAGVVSSRAKSQRPGAVRVGMPTRSVPEEGREVSILCVHLYFCISVCIRLKAVVSQRQSMEKSPAQQEVCGETSAKARNAESKRGGRDKSCRRSRPQERSESQPIFCMSFNVARLPVI